MHVYRQVPTCALSSGSLSVIPAPVALLPLVIHDRETCHWCVLQVRNNIEALQQMVDQAAAVTSLAQLISAGQAEPIQEQAAQLLGLITSNLPDAKIAAVQAQCVPKLLALLDQPSNILLASAAVSALMIITVDISGKFALVRCEGGLATLSGHWLDPSVSEKLCLNITQCITNVAECPEARPVLQGCGTLARLLAIHEDQQNTEIVRRGAAEALRQCRFNFLPHQILPGRVMPSGEALAVSEALAT